MTDEEIQIEIAKAVGWEWHNTQAGGCYVSPDKRRTARRWQDLPNYPNDLNAMHEAEQCLTNGEYETFGTALVTAAEKAHSAEILKGRFILSAEARQRAEAFLRTIGKWKD